MIWQNFLSVEERSSDLAELPVPVIWQNCLSADSVPVIWQNCLYVEEHAINVLPVIWQNCLCRQCFGRIVCLRTVCQ